MVSFLRTFSLLKKSYKSEPALDAKCDNLAQPIDLTWIFGLPSEIVCLILKELPLADLVTLSRFNLPIQDAILQELARGPLYIDNLRSSHLARVGRLRLKQSQFVELANKHPYLKFGKIVTTTRICINLYTECKKAIETAEEIELVEYDCTPFFNVDLQTMSCNLTLVCETFQSIDSEFLPKTSLKLIQRLPAPFNFQALFSEEVVSAPILPEHLKSLEVPKLTIDASDISILPQTLETLQICINCEEDLVDISHLKAISHLSITVNNLESLKELILPSQTKELQLDCPTIKDFDSLDSYEHLRKLTIYSPKDISSKLFTETSFPRNLKVLILKKSVVSLSENEEESNEQISGREFAVPPKLRELRVEVDGNIGFLNLPPSTRTLDLKGMRVDKCNLSQIHNLALREQSRSQLCALQESDTLESLSLYSSDLNFAEPILLNSNLKEFCLHFCEMSYTRRQLDAMFSQVANLEVFKLTSNSREKSLFYPLFNYRWPRKLKVLALEINPPTYSSWVELKFCTLGKQFHLPPSLQELQIICPLVRLSKEFQLPASVRCLTLEGIPDTFKFRNLQLPPKLEYLSLMRSWFNITDTIFPSTLVEFYPPSLGGDIGEKRLHSTNLESLDWINQVNIPFIS
ncbi:hypothetical protein G9P44_001493 [Scheffersomyces stipitis]|nr:hypothetical protein G9P44_001493 [Scheffersomyces stipitis]